MHLASRLKETWKSVDRLQRVLGYNELAIVTLRILSDVETILNLFF